MGKHLGLGGRGGSREDVNSETSQLFKQQGHKHLRLRGLRVPDLHIERTWEAHGANWRSLWLKLLD